MSFRYYLPIRLCFACADTCLVWSFLYFFEVFVFQQKVVEAQVRTLPFSTEVIQFVSLGWLPPGIQDSFPPFYVQLRITFSVTLLKPYFSMAGGKNTTRMRKKLNSVLFTRDALRIEMSGRKSLKSCKDCSFTSKLKKGTLKKP